MVPEGDGAKTSGQNLLGAAQDSEIGTNLTQSQLEPLVYDEEQKKAHDEQDSERKQQVGSGDRSERIRTYNYPQERVTDHRIGLTLHKLSAIMEGAMEEVIDALTLHFQSEALKGND